MRKKRDGSRKKLYKSEHEAALSCPGEPLRSREEVDAFALKIVRSKWWKKERGCVLVQVIHTNYQQKAWGGPGYIKIPSWAWKSDLGIHGRWIVLHELAHVLIFSRYLGADYLLAGHGREFCALYLKAVRRWLGVSHWKALKDAFRAHGVKHTRYSQKRVQAARERFNKTGGLPWEK
jgi:hypothetical protein